MTDGSSHSTYDLYQRGLTQLKSGHAERAMFLLETAKVREPKNRMLAEILGRTYLSLRFYSRARKEFTQLTVEDPTDDYAHFCLALCYDRLHSAPRALLHYKLAYALSPKSKLYKQALHDYQSYGSFYPTRPTS
jgi:tetratricopeptide (TPR) repeat protein